MNMDVFALIRRFKKIVACALLCIFSSSIYASTLIAFKNNTLVKPVNAVSKSVVSHREMGSFSAVEPGDWVNKFTGDFNYSIPLFEIGGYPINMSYNSNVANESQASWVGLGWNLNPGNISRNMRGLPDDFQPGSDYIDQSDRMKTNDRYTLGIQGELLAELAGFPFIKQKLAISPSLNFELFYDSYSRFGYGFGVGLSLAPSKNDFTGKITPSGQIGLNFGSDNGLSASAGLTIQKISKDEEAKTTETKSGTISSSYNARQGVGDVGVNLQRSIDRINDDGTMTKIKAGTSGNARFTLGSRSYIPNSKVPISNLSFSGNLKLGGELAFLKAGFVVLGAYRVSRLAGVRLFSPPSSSPLLKRRLKAYGYLDYVESRDYNQTNAVYDVNTENEAGLSEFTPAYGLGFATYDMFQVSAQGVSGAYRAHKASPITVISDGYVDANGGNQRVDLEGINIGAELAGGQLLGIGLNGGIQFGDEHSSGWNADDMPSLSRLGTSSEKQNSFYRPSYFKQVGILTPLNSQVYNATFAEAAFNFPLDKGLILGATSTPWRNYAGISNRIKVLSEFKAKKYPNDKNFITKSLQNSYRTENRIANPQAFTYYTAQETIALEKGGNKTYYTDNRGIKKVFDRTTSKRKSNHISRIDIARNDGYQFHFGLPVYCLTQKEASFNVSNDGRQSEILSDANSPIKSELCKYDLGIGGLPSGKGLSDYLNTREYSPYATAFLLTEVLSPDYYDLGGDGPSKDDLGDYVKLTYKSWFDNNTGSFKWKSPAAHFETRNSNDSQKRHLYANYDEGRASKNAERNGDATGFYTYGEKEVWYVDTIRSKEKVAIFHTSDSESPFDASLTREHGSYNSQKFLAKLDSIQIFTIKDFEETGIPEQTIHFRYNYELCKLRGETDAGKLTLKRMFRTFRDSKKSAYNDYNFEYAFNPDYASYLRDAWGNYQGLTANISEPNYNLDIENRPENYIESPFTLQDNKSRADLNASAWCLTSIELPTGGRLEIEYESDSYAYVQNKRAGRVYPIAGFSNSASATGLSNKLYNTANKESNNYVFVDIGQYTSLFARPGVSNQTALALYWKEALRGLESIPIRCLVDITNDSDYEYVKLNAEFDANDQGIVAANGKTYGYVRLEEQKFSRNNKKSIQAVAKHSLQIAREDFFQKIFTGQLNGTGLENILGSLVGFAGEVSAMIKGQENVLFEKKFGSRVNLSKSMIVLQEPSQNKFGGGARVKKIEMNDRWSNMTSNNHKDGISGWAYSYDMADTLYSATGDTIFQKVSSGVAEWEPSLCSFENLNLKSIEAVDKKIAAPNNSNYQTAPYGMSIFPTANVGYSNVSVTMIRPQNQNGTQVVPIGKTVCTYHTAKDFPIITSHTNNDFEKFPKNPLAKINLLGTGATSIGVASQGFSIVLNDMHGKQKLEEHFKASQKAAFRTVEYDYLPLNSFSTQNNKENEVSLLSSNGTAYKNQVGIEHDITVFTKEHYSITRSLQLNPGLDLSIIFIPIPIVSILEPPNSEAVLGRVITATKVVYKYAVLNNVTTTEDGAKTEARNLAYDEVTGQPILTQNINEYQDSVYSFKYPAHWMYNRFKPRVARDGIVLSNLSWDATGTITGGDEINGQRVLVDGDVLINKNLSIAYQVYENNNGQLALANKWGNNHGAPLNFPQSASVRIIAEGNENKLSQNAGQVLSLGNPIINNQLRINSATKVLDAKAMTFKQFTLDPVPCYCQDEILNRPITQLLAKSHRWYPEAEYLVKRDRQYTQKAGHQFNLRRDGIYNDFTPFWKKIFGIWRPRVGGWTFKQANTMVNTFGKPEEFMDPFNRFSTVKWGHNQTLKRAEIFNVSRDEGYLQDFEFIGDENCLENIAPFGTNDISIQAPHTGRNALRINPKSNLIVHGTAD